MPWKWLDDTPKRKLEKKEENIDTTHSKTMKVKSDDEMAQEKSAKRNTVPMYAKEVTERSLCKKIRWKEKIY